MLFLNQNYSIFSHYVILENKIDFHDSQTPHSLSTVRSAEKFQFYIGLLFCICPNEMRLLFMNYLFVCLCLWSVVNLDCYTLFYYFGL